MAAQQGDGEVRQLLHDMIEAWNAGDAAAFAGCFTDSAEFVSWRGRRDTGRAAIEARHRDLFAGPLRGAWMNPDPTPYDVTYLAPDVALVVAAGVRSTALPEALAITITAVCEGGWRFASFHNTVAAPTSER
ncbi:MAG TPA: SgcJ/EcaC family oxidoreductase [Actinocatenispora sp.]